jgi:hypothetical protein
MVTVRKNCELGRKHTWRVDGGQWFNGEGGAIKLCSENVSITRSEVNAQYCTSGYLGRDAGSKQRLCE